MRTERLVIIEVSPIELRVIYPQTDRASTAALRIESCGDIDPMELDLARVQRDMAACDLLDGTHVEVTVSGADMVNHGVRVRRDGVTVAEFRPEPHSTVRTEGFGASRAVACDGQGRLYFLHTDLGFVVAFDRNGHELWRYQLPDFIPLESRWSGKAITMPEAFDAFRDWASKGQQIRASGEYVAVEYKVRGDATWHMVFHRSGAPIGRVGPWDGVLFGVSSSGWNVATGGGSDLRFYVPKKKVDLEVADRTTESVVRHAIAWIMPRPTDRDLHMNCLSRLDNELEYWLGDRFVAADAAASKRLVVRRGAARHDDLQRRPAVQEILKSFNPPSRAWQSDYLAALGEAGADVDLAATCDTPGKTSPKTPNAANRNPESTGPLVREKKSTVSDLARAVMPIGLEIHGGTLETAFLLIGGASGMGIEVESSVRSHVIDVSFGKVPLGAVLESLSRRYGITYDVLDRDTLRVEAAPQVRENP